MAKVIGYDEKVFKRFTCRDCGAIVEYAPREVGWKTYDDGCVATDEGAKIAGLKCPGCGEFHRL